MPLSLSLEMMPLEEKLPEPMPPKTMVVRYGYLKLIGEFVSEITSKIGCGSKVVIRTERGMELAEMLTTTCSNGGCEKSVTREKMLSYIQASGGNEYPFSENGRVVRVATAQDLAEQAKLDEQRHGHITMARELVARHNLPMKIVEVEYMLGGERVMFYFTSENRIDFRTLVRDMAHNLHTRIELRQVGARDDARLTADYEKCGQHCCCKQFLKVLTPISMKAAKIQKATLDPAKISGRCGRLMCCLRYEDQTYDELRKKLPKRNTRVKTEKGDGWVVDGQILTQLVLVLYDDFKREAVPLEKILAFDQPKPVMADGRTMQSPNDRPPLAMQAEGGPGGARGARPGPGGPAAGPGARPAPGGRPMQGGPGRGPGGPRPQGAPMAGGPRSQGAPTTPAMPAAPAMQATPGEPVADVPGAPGAPGVPSVPGPGPMPNPRMGGPNAGPPQQRPPQGPMNRPGAAPPMRGPRGPQQGPGQQQGGPRGLRGPGPQRQGGPGGSGGPGGPGRPPQGPRARGPLPFRPQPGMPAPQRQGDPLATTGPTGGDLNPGDSTPTMPPVPPAVQPPALPPEQRAAEGGQTAPEAPPQT